MGNANILPTAPAFGPSYASEFSDKPPYYTHKPDGVVPVRYAKEGPASKDPATGCPAETMTSVFKRAAEKFPNKVALAYEADLPPFKKGEKPLGPKPLAEWTKITYKEYYAETMKVAKAMISLGLEKNDACNVFGFNSVEWFLSQMGVIAAGGRVAGIYPSDTAEQFRYKNDHSNGSIVACDTEANYKKIESQVDSLPYLKAIVYWGFDKSMEDIKRSDGTSVKVLQWKEFVKLGDGDGLQDKLTKRLEDQEPGGCCSLIYTSGTTGSPKAVMCSHDNIVFAATNLDCYQLEGWGKTEGEEERIISYLPLSHVAGSLVDIINPICTTAKTKGYCSVYFARPYDLKAGTLGDRLRSVKPTLFFGVPRVFEKIADKIKAVGAKTKGVKRKIADWAKAKCLSHQRNCQIGGSGAKPWLYPVAEKLLVNKIKATLGLDCCKLLMTGAAPITMETTEFFANLGLCINELYGMSESNGASTWSSIVCHQWGTVGYTLPGTELKILKKEGDKWVESPRCKDIFSPTEEQQGEICFRGRHIMMGYMANPKLGAEHVKEIDEKNSSAIDSEGWLHSGDKGAMSETGMIKITGRYKELIITAGGENVAPVPIEDGVKLRCPAVSNIIMIGDKRKFNVCLISLKVKGATGEVPGGNELDGPALDAVKKGVTTVEAAFDDEKLIKTITDAITATNKDGSCCPSNASKIQKFTIIPTDFSVETGELTATLKLKRSVVEKQYTKQIDAMYSSKETYVKYQK